MKKVIDLVTHGGLGNQLFQICAGLSIAFKEEARLSVWHDTRYKHGFELSPELEGFGRIEGSRRALCKLRLPKVANRFFRWESEYFKLGPYFLLDGYFQNLEFYDAIPSVCVRQSLEFLSERFVEKNSSISKEKLLHIRVPDFLIGVKATEFVENALAPYKNEKISVISNSDELVMEVSKNQELKVSIIGTEGESASSVLKTMMGYQQIVGTTSTLAFWASILGKTDLNLSSHRSGDIHSYFKSLRN